LGAGAGDNGFVQYDTIFRVLKLEAPVSVEPVRAKRYEKPPAGSIVRYNFAARGDMPRSEIHVV